jgi:hypothetical protein
VNATGALYSRGGFKGPCLDGVLISSKKIKIKRKKYPEYETCILNVQVEV